MGKMAVVSVACVQMVVTMLLIGRRVIAALEESNDCITYSAKLTSVPDLTHRIVYSEKRSNDLKIVDVKSTNYQRSFYWCQLDIRESDNSIKRYRNFGFNNTHWWVEMGCGGWFIVTECRSGVVDAFFDSVVPPEKTLKSSVAAGSGNGIQISAHDWKGSSIIDKMYNEWPSVGYRFPTTGKMWDVLDNLTYVDVAQQLGFYNNHSKAGTTLFG